MSSSCKKHAADVSSAVGVCASCLRQRLFAVVAAQAEKQHQLLQQPPSDQRLEFPRSVSPYVSSRRKSEKSDAWRQPSVNGHGHRQRFYSTPQVGPTGSVTLEIREKRRTKVSSLLSRIFRSDSSRGSDSSSWLSSVFSTRRKKRGSTAVSLDEGRTPSRRPTGLNNKGLAPARCSFDGEEEEDGGGGSSGKSPERRANIPSNASATRRRRKASAAGNSRSTSSGLAFCLSPLVRASPSHRNWSSELAVSGESRLPHLSKTASLCKNRSRKLADFGSYNSHCVRSNR